MHVEGLNNLIQGIFSHFENQTSGKAAISQFIKRWLENPGKRDELAPGVNKNTSLSTSSDDNRKESLPKAAEVVQSINEMQPTERDNLDLWKSEFKTDERLLQHFR